MSILGWKLLKSGPQLNPLCRSLLLRFGKHRRDERPGDRMERKGSSKSKAEDMQASEEETLRMRLEQERWVLRQSFGSLKASTIKSQLEKKKKALLTGKLANYLISKMAEQGWEILGKYSDVNLWKVLFFYISTLNRSFMDCCCLCHSEALTS